MTYYPPQYSTQQFGTPGGALAYGTFVIDGPVKVMISITEVGDGTLKVAAEVLDETGAIGDLRGLFFDVADESLISGLRITGSSVTRTQFSEDAVSNLGSGNNVSGSIINEYGKFDVGVAFGTAGIGKDDIREASFILSHNTAELTYDFLAVQDFAVRLTSVGDGSDREDSLKLGGTSPAACEPVNAPPEPVDDAAETDEDTGVSLNLLANDSDPDGDALTVTSVAGHAAGTSFAVTSAAGRTGTATVGANGVLGFDPGAAFQDLGVGESDTVTVSYTISDGNGGTASANATITVRGLNDGPVAVDDAGVTDEDTAVSMNLLANDTDPDGDPLTVTSVNGHAAGMAFTVVSTGGRTGTMTLGANGVLAFDPADGFQDLGVGESDTVTVSYAIADGNGGTATANATVTVHGLNDGPVALDDQGETDEDTAVSLDLLANDSDPDGDALTVTSVNGRAAGVSFAVTSAGGRTGTATLGANGVLAFDPGSAFQDLGVGESDAVTVSYTIADGNGGTATANATMTVHGLNDGPVAVDDAGETNEETAVSLNLLANDSDPDGDALTVTSANGYAAGTSFAVVSAGGRTGTATLGANGALGFDPGAAFQDLGVGKSDAVIVSYAISDGNGGTATANATITVHGLNDGPLAVDDLGETDEDTAVSMDLLANDSDPDGDRLAVSSLNGHAAGASFAVTSAGGRTGTATLGAAGTLTVDPSGAFDDLRAGEVDTVSVLYQISDGNGGTDTARATVFVHGINDAPVALDDAYRVPEAGLSVLDILANDSDPEGDPLTVTLLTQPIDGSVSVAPDGTVTFDPGTDFLGLSEGQTATVTFDYQISDGQLTDTASVTVTVVGEGTFDPGTVTEREVVPVGDTPVTTTIETPGKTNDGTVDLRLSVALGDLAQSKYNILYVVDVSGSTGVDGSFGSTTVLDAQIAALQDLTAEFMGLGLPEGSMTITVLPFNSRALPTAPVDGQAYPRVIFGDNEVLNAADVDASLAALNAGGETNYVAAVFAAMGTIQTLEQQRGDAVNLVYFLSDGNPFPANSQPVSLLTQVSAQLKAQASVHGVALGELVDPQYVNALDNTGGAQLITDDPTALGAALREAPMDAGVILGAELTLYDAEGAAIDSFHFTGADFVETPLGFELNVENVGGLDFFAGRSNTAELLIEFDDNGDAVADSTLSMAVEIECVLPESYDS